MGISIHPSAIVSAKAQIADNVEIGPFTIIEDDVVIGEGTTVGSSVLCANGARIGRNCKIHKGAVVATPPQDLKYKNEATTCEIGDNTTVREFCTLNRGTTEHWKSVIGSNCLLMAYAHVAHDCTIGNNVIIANAVQMGGHVTIHDWAIVGGLTAVHQFSMIGAHAMIQGQKGVAKDVPPFVRAGREPMVFEGINSVGLRRRGFSAETIAAISEAYHIIYGMNFNVSQAVAHIEKELALTPEIAQILEFIKCSKRGILSGRSH
ncbi:MAG TPA: acyl-ACP--UDP-N-acetylglucosamine O-acyltransferase [Bacteroidota bacterium]|nr:acyl-ACP--UDP-N-acetylglucosamine O-acyltransferase [Bacteroidota bacterium]